MDKLTPLLKNVDEFTGFARKRLADPELAADAVQEACSKRLNRATNFATRKLRKHGSTVSCAAQPSISTAAVMHATEPSLISGTRSIFAR